MASSSSHQGSTTQSSHFKHDVFLSFRGHTRLRFTDTVYHALINKRIETFRDSNKLRIGEDVEGALMEAIERSRMSILILSATYPTSRWCLDELVKIMDCSDNGRKRPVLPIFYFVEPSDVKYQSNEYGKAMTGHENKGRYNHRLEAWKSALFAVGNKSGLCINKNTPWGEAINKIVEEVTRIVPPLPLYIDRPLGCDSELEEVKSLLKIDSSHATCLMLGIHGDGDISKFVVELYNKIRPHFVIASFLSNINGKTNESGCGLEDLQGTLLSEMGEKVKTKIGSTFKGSTEIKERLGQKRVLLVLDDVGRIQQLESLAGQEDWFGPGSRIIITTRNEGLLDAHGFNNGFAYGKYCFRGNQIEEDDVDEGGVVGFTNNSRFVIKQLCDDNINVVSIIGMGGLGKTTLAQKVYDNNEVKNLFPCRGWGHVSKDCKPREVWLGLLDSLMLSTSKYHNSTEKDLKKTVRNCLKGKKYLIVLDDIWESEVWDNLKAAFPNESNGSKILITSRSEEMANYTSSKSYKPPLLDEKESWELFCKKVFLAKECPSELEPHGRSIVESCGGLPLAIVAIAGVVAKKKRLESEWLGVKECIHWHLTRDMSKVMDVLKLSYDSLSEELKPCFRCLGIYPEDYKIPAAELIRLWMAEGFVQPKESGLPNAPEPEIVGEEYLKELVDRNMIHVARKRSSDGGVKNCLIHDLFRDLCIILSKADKFFEVCTRSNIHTVGNPQRLSLLCSEMSTISSLETNQSNTLSLFFFSGKKYSMDVLRNVQSVQVLHLGKRTRIQGWSYNFEAMTFLKYLRIEICDYIKDLCRSIWSLSNLETIDVQSFGTTCIPNEFWKLKQLRHVYLGLGSVKLLTDENGTIMWNLQTLYGVDLDTAAAFLFRNGRFPNLRKLALWLDPRTKKSCSWHELLLSLHRLRNLRKLKLHCCRSDFSLDAKMFPSNIAKITLVVGKMECSSMKVLGQLPNLQVLKLFEGSIPESLDCATGDFPKLQVFKMVHVWVESWMLPKGAMPVLRYLLVKRCDELRALPEQLWALTTLSEVHVINPSNELANSLQHVKVKDNCDLTISYTENA